MSDKWKGVIRQMLTVGTPECAVFFGVAAMVLALLFLLLGFWKTLLVVVLVGLGAFLGGVRNKKDWVKNVINKLFPPKTVIPYREQATTEDIEKAFRAAKEKENTEEENKE